MEERTLAKTPRSQSMDENGIGKEVVDAADSTVSLAHNSWNLFIHDEERHNKNRKQPPGLKVPLAILASRRDEPYHSNKSLLLRHAVIARRNDDSPMGGADGTT